jgi:hypothetical protein
MSPWRRSRGLAIAQLTIDILTLHCGKGVIRASVDTAKIARCERRTLDDQIEGWEAMDKLIAASTAVVVPAGVSCALVVLGYLPSRLRSRVQKKPAAFDPRVESHLVGHNLLLCAAGIAISTCVAVVLEVRHTPQAVVALAALLMYCAQKFTVACVKIARLDLSADYGRSRRDINAVNQDGFFAVMFTVLLSVALGAADTLLGRGN